MWQLQEEQQKKNKKNREGQEKNKSTGKLQELPNKEVIWVHEKVGQRKCKKGQKHS